MSAHYKIKVGIEEYPIKESDIPRIVEAMKTDNMVQLEYGLFRGHAILAISRDLEREEQDRLLEASKPSDSQKLEKEREEAQKARTNACLVCLGKGVVEIVRKTPSGSPDNFMRKCVCAEERVDGLERRQEYAKREIEGRSSLPHAEERDVEL